MITASLVTLFLFVITEADVSNAQCPSGLEWDPSGNSCFTVVRASLSSYDAQIACSAINGYLAEIYSVGEWNFVKGYLQRKSVDMVWVYLEY